MTVVDEYNVQLDVFDGPLDLLLYLIRKDEVDIYDIPIKQITSQYVEYLNLMKMLDLSIAGEFIVMAATLMMIKSRMLLPAEERPDLEDDDEEDPRWDLVRQLVEYKKFKDAADYLQGLEYVRQNMFASGAGVERPEPDIDPGLKIGDVSLFDLLTAFNHVLERARDEEIGEIYAEQFNVTDKIAAILEAVGRTGQMTFEALFDGKTSRHEIAVTFLALLEIIKLRQVHVKQRKEFGEIFIERVLD